MFVETLQGRAIIRDVDGFKPKGIKNKNDISEEISQKYWIQVL
jgi:adenosine/AMP kinase